MEAAGAWIADAVALAIIGVLAVGGWRRGLIGSVVGIAGFIIAIWAGARYAAPLAERYATELPHHVSYGIAFIIVLLCVVFLVGLAGKLVDMLLGATPLSPLNTLAGAAIGALKGIILVALIAAVLALVPGSRGVQASYSQARTVRMSVVVTGAVVGVVKPYVSEPMSRFMDLVGDLMNSAPRNITPRSRGRSTRT